MKRIIFSFLLLSGWLFTSGTPFADRQHQKDLLTPPDPPVKLIFIHHSSGENLLRDDYGGLGQALSNNNYFVSDTNYGWGPDAIGDRTDIPNWLEWFRSDNTARIMDAVYNESGQNSDYTRTLTDPGGENEVILFKSCFPNSDLDGKPDDPPTPGTDLTVGDAKYVYNEILKYFATRPDKLFIVITAPPVQDPTFADNARAFNQWLVKDWLSENAYPLNNVAVFDFYNVLTGTDGHHRYQNGVVEHIVARKNTSAYPSARDDDHPSIKGSQKATEEFIPLLNYYVQRWKSEKPAAAVSTTPLSPVVVTTSSPEDMTTVSPVEALTVPHTEEAQERQGSRGIRLPYGSAMLLPLGVVGMIWWRRRKRT